MIQVERAMVIVGYFAVIYVLDLYYDAHEYKI